MQIRLDPNSLFLTCAVVQFVLTFIITYTFIRIKTYPGFKSWVFANWFSLIGIVLFLLRGTLPNLVSIFLPNLLFISSIISVQSGLLKFSNKEPCYVSNGILFMFYAILILIFLNLYDNSTIRIIIFSFASSYLYIQTSYICDKNLDDGNQFTKTLAVPVTAIIGTLYLIRAIVVCLEYFKISHFLNESTLLSIGILIYLGSQMILTISLLVLNSHRMEAELSHIIKEFKVLRGIIPICAYCKKIRDDKGAWEQIEEYMRDHSEATFSHGICPDCRKKTLNELSELVK